MEHVPRQGQIPTIVDNPQRGSATVQVAGKGFTCSGCTNERGKCCQQQH
jgi:hypothetical protein